MLQNPTHITFHLQRNVVQHQHETQLLPNLTKTEVFFSILFVHFHFSNSNLVVLYKIDVRNILFFRYPIARQIHQKLISNQQEPSLHYGNTGCRVFKGGIQNWKDFGLKMNIPKGNGSILGIRVVASFQKLGIILENKVF